MKFGTTVCPIYKCLPDEKNPNMTQRPNLCARFEVHYRATYFTLAFFKNINVYTEGDMNYCMQAHLSLMQHKSPQIVCNPKVIILD